VATNTGGIPEVVVDGEKGLLVPPRDHHALAHAIAALLKDQKRREQMGAAGLERVQRIFSAERMVEKTLEVYRNLSADSARPAARG
jgi:glycosyltransferase involved in cell wall biosynthesis